MTTMSSKKTNENNWTFERDLSALACDAAIEIDSLIINDPQELIAVQKLADKIKELVPSRTQDSSQHFLYDPVKIVVMNRAIKNDNLKSIDDLVREADTISQKLKNIESNYKKGQIPDKKDLEKLRTFCIELSEQASSYQRPFYDMEPHHPYRY